MTEKDVYYQDDIEDSSFDEEEIEANESSDEEEHFQWWLRYGNK